MNDDPRPWLRDVLMRRELTADEERRLTQWLARHPEATTDWSEEVALARVLRGLRSVEVPAHFTSRVMAEVRREAAARDRKRPGRGLAGEGWWRAWRSAFSWGRMASVAAGVVVLGAGAGAWHWQTVRRSTDEARQVAALRAMASFKPEVLADFEAIRRFGDSSVPVDYELLAALQ